MPPLCPAVISLAPQSQHPKKPLTESHEQPQVKSNCQLLIIGAGAAGIGAAHAASEKGQDYLVVEASHRVGGRGLTEELAPGIPWDLGCHWMHSGGINPLVQIAESLKIHYDTYLPSRHFYLKGKQLEDQEVRDYEDFCNRIWSDIEQMDAKGQDLALADLIDHDSPWAPYYRYWQSLMTSEDVDNFSALDLLRYEDTNENWPVRDGYGALLERHAQPLEIALNTAVTKIDWSGTGVTVETNRGTLKADKVIVTVSTGVLGARDIEFHPALPVEKEEAIAALPLGCYNNFAMLYEEDSSSKVSSKTSSNTSGRSSGPFGPDAPDRIDYSNGDDINFAFKLRCSGWPYIYCAVAGRQARWLERQPEQESEHLMMSALTDIFGSDIKSKIIKFRRSAWGDDPLVKGAYSASQPGHADKRGVLGAPLAERLYFAGEATSVKAFCTAHGAWQSGKDAVELCNP